MLIEPQGGGNSIESQYNPSRRSSMLSEGAAAHLCGFPHTLAPEDACQLIGELIRVKGLANETIEPLVISGVDFADMHGIRYNGRTVKSRVGP